MSAPSPTPSNNSADDCSICLNALATGATLLTLACNHKFHLDCLASNVKASNNQCPLCRVALDASLIQMLAGNHGTAAPATIQLPVVLAIAPPTAAPVIPSVEDPIDEEAARALSARITSARQAAIASNLTNSSLITAVTTLEFGGQVSYQESNIYGLVTLQAPPASWSLADELSLSSSRVPIDLICVVDQSGSMAGEKIALLKQTLIYIVEQMSELDRLAVVSFNTQAFDRSHGLKRMTQQNKETLKTAIMDDIRDNGGTYIGSGIQMAIDLFNSRQTKNPTGAVLLLTDGQDNQHHDYSQLMQRLPNGTLCHAFGYGPDHTASLLAQLAEQGNGGTFTYIDEQAAVGTAFVTVLAGLLSCVAQNIRVNIEFDGEYKITHAHSKYKYEPERLPSSKLTFKLNDLNADEKRNLVFQLSVPKIEDEPSVDMASQEPMSQSQTLEGNEQATTENHVIVCLMSIGALDRKIIYLYLGRVTIDYAEPNSGRTITIEPVSFRLIRAPQLSANQLAVNYTIDIQRNRVETARVLRQAMEERDYTESLRLLRAQVENIEASISVEDPFCQNLISDLQQSFPTEREYRSSHHNTYRCHDTERGTYNSSGTSSSQLYVSPQQRAQVAHFMNKYT